MFTAAQAQAYFDLQLSFAEAMMPVDHVPIEISVTRNTNIHRRFGLGSFDEEAVDPLWRDCMMAVARAGSHGARLEHLCRFYAQARAETLPTGQIAFGCFKLEQQVTKGVVRLHFGHPIDNPANVGPLHSARRNERMAELRAMFAYVKAHCPDARIVRGGSWLYHLEAYRRLFPSGFGASRSELVGNRKFSGTSSWGQFLDHRGDVKPALAATFRRNLENLDPANPARTFPLPALKTEAPVDEFFVFYGV